MKVAAYTVCLNEEKLNILVCASKKDYGVEERFDAPEKVAYFMWDYLEGRMPAEEYLYMIALDAKHVPIGIFEVSHGSVNSAIAWPREVYIRALLCGAVGIILVHNHPSGDTIPSSDDIRITKNLAFIGEIIGIQLLDHIVIGRIGHYTSMCRENLIGKGDGI